MSCPAATEPSSCPNTFSDCNFSLYICNKHRFTVLNISDMRRIFRRESEDTKWYQPENRAAFPVFCLEGVNSQISSIYYVIAEVLFLLPSEVISTVDVMT